MRLSTVIGLPALLASSALAAPFLQARQTTNTSTPRSSDDNDQLLLSPLNGTAITSGGTLSFSYRTDRDDDDDDENEGPRYVRVALFQRVEIARDLLLVDDGAGGLTVSQDITLPAGLAAGEYFIGVSESDDDSNDNNDNNDDDDDDDDAVGGGQNSTSTGTAGNTTATARYNDYDYTFDYPAAAQNSTSSSGDDERRVYVSVGAAA